ncbi:hypothetical protein HYV49_06420 [Candidatus Pacearchaeota archaeon]|nr:hypothetical protein [Candidatus Pacearchaeota archaeon]
MEKMVVARVNIPDDLDRFIGTVKNSNGFSTKNEALNFIIKEYERINGVTKKEKANDSRRWKNIAKDKKTHKKLHQNHINEIKSVLNGE